MKRLFSVIVVITFLMSCIGLQVSAVEETAIVSLLGEKQAIVGSEYEVTLNVKESTSDVVGGLFCDITFESTKFELERVEIPSDFATVNKFDEDSNIINYSNTNKVSIALLSVKGDSVENNWITLVFNVKDAVGSATFDIDNVELSDAAGVNLITNSHKTDVTKNIYAHMLDVNGASIRKDGVGNIRFEAEIDATVDRTKIEEIGFLMIPAVCLNNGDLTFTNEFAASDTEQKYHLYTMANGNKVSIASNYKEMYRLSEDENKVYCYLTNTISYKLSTAFAARAYVKMIDGTIIYSDNQTYVANSNSYEKNIKGGTSSKSCIETAKAIYNIYKDNENVTFSDEFKNIIVKDLWDNTEYKTIVAELANVSDSFN